MGQITVLWLAVLIAANTVVCVGLSALMRASQSYPLAGCVLLFGGIALILAASNGEVVAAHKALLGDAMTVTVEVLAVAHSVLVGVGGALCVLVGMLSVAEQVAWRSQ